MENTLLDKKSVKTKPLTSYSVAPKNIDDPPLCQISCKQAFGYMKNLFLVMLPISITLAIEVGYTLMNLYFVGTFNDGDLLGGVGLGNTCVNCIGIYTILAMNTGL